MLNPPSSHLEVPPPSEGTPLSRGSYRHALAALLAWILCSAAYLVTADGVRVCDNDRDNAWHHYEYLVDGFLSGHLSLSIQPPKELLSLPDPYDPKQNYQYRLWDVSLYKGKYYLYYGPTPAVLAMLPWRAITGHHLPQRLAAGIFASVGLAALALLLAGLRTRYFATIRPSALFFTILLAGHLSWLPVLLRRPAFWELPIVAAAALFWWSLYFLWRYLESRHEKRRWGIAAGATLALLLGARPTFIFAAAVAVLVTAFPAKRLRDIVRQASPVVVPLVLGGALLLAYNYLRFDSVFEFGQSYQLWGPVGQVNSVDERHVQHFSPAYLPFNAWLYLLSVPSGGVYFPFLHPPWITELPTGYIATEEVYGLLIVVPAYLTGLVAILKAIRARRDADTQPLRVVIWLGVSASVLAAAILFCFAGACTRYVVELVAGWCVVSSVGMLVLMAQRTQAGHRRVATLFATGLGVWSIGMVWLASYEFRAFARIAQPTLYPILARTLNYPSHWLAEHEGQQFGPVSVDVRLAETPSTGVAPLIAAGSGGTLNQLVIERVAPDQYRLRLTVNNLVLVETPLLRTTAKTLRIQCGAPWLYPPAAHPYWSRFADLDERKRRQTLYSIAVDGTEYFCRSIWGFDASSFEPFVRTVDSLPKGCAWVEHWRHFDRTTTAHAVGR